MEKKENKKEKFVSYCGGEQPGKRLKNPASDENVKKQIKRMKESK